MTVAAPRLGFGCASMGSRKSAGESLAALDRAYTAGIRWFDVAPSYGDGDAERILGRFVRDRRDGLTICTKVGIQPGHVSLVTRLARPILRLALTAVPDLRGAIRRRRPAAVRQPLTADLITRSVDQSLARLGVGQIDVLALHDATPEEVVRDDVLRAVEDVTAAGKADRIGIASSPAAARAGLASSPVYRMVQVANNLLEPGLAALRPALADRPDTIVVTHSVFGASGAVEALTDRVARDSNLAAAMNDAGLVGTPREIALCFLADHAFASRGADVVLLSMFARRHLHANVARHALTRDADAIDRVAQLVALS